MEMAPSRFDIETEKPKTLKEYLQELPASNEKHQQRPTNSHSDGKVVVVARIGEYNKQMEGVEWKVISEPTFTNESLEFTTEREFEKDNIESGLDYTLEKDDIQRYISDYQDLLYTFKDFVKIGADPTLKEKLFDQTTPNQKQFNVTYVMPIPKTKKYFEIKMNNLTENQYNELNTLIQEHMQNKSHKSALQNNKEYGIIYVDVGNENMVTSRDLTEPSSRPDWSLQRTTPQNSSMVKNWPRTPGEALAYFQKMFSEENRGKLYTTLKPNNTSNLSDNPVDDSATFANNTIKQLIKNNGFHAEIATDYVHKSSDGEGNKNIPNSDTFDSPVHFSINTKQPANDDNINSKSRSTVSDIHDSIEETATTILNPIFTQRNTAKLTQLPRFKRPVGYQSNSTQSRRRVKVNNEANVVQTLNIPTSATPQQTASVLESSLDVYATPTLAMDQRKEQIINEFIKNFTLPQTHSLEAKKTYMPEQTTPSIITQQDWIDISKLYNNVSINRNPAIELPTLEPYTTPSGPATETTKKVESLSSLNIMQAANWILDMKKRIQEEERKKNERYKNYIKQFLGGDGSSILLGRGEDGNVMKINKQDNILEELKLLMLDYFASMNFNNHPDTVNNSSSPAVESILNATNIFELMEQASQLVKLNLQTKIQTETKEPTGFVKKIVESQADKCKQIFNSTLLAKARQKSPEAFKKNSHRRFLVFTKCMNFKLKRCIKGFSMWLEKGKFYLRPQFQLDRAYENYEIERNLYCLRTYNASSLDSNPHGVRVRPGTKVNRKSGMRRMRTGQSKTRFRMMKMRNGEHASKAVRRNMSRNRKYNNRQENNRNLKNEENRKYRHQPTVQRYSDSQKIVSPRQEN